MKAGLAKAVLHAAAARLGLPVPDYLHGLSLGKRFCSGCRHWVLPEEIAPSRSRCKECVSAAKKTHYLNTRPQQRARQLQYQRTNRERLYAYNAKWQRERNAALRAECLKAYGSKCNCCGEAQAIFLDLDHVFNDGAAHRKELGNNRVVMLALRAAGWPTDKFQLLCCNCNQGKARNGGVCPHVNAQS